MKIWIFFIITSFTIGCSTSQKSISFEKVKKGEQLEYAQEISVEQFFLIWMNNRQNKIDVNCHELYKNTNYTYFGKNKLKYLSLTPNLYKVNSDSLALKFGDYNKIDAQTIRKEFWDKVVPTSDKDIFEKPVCTNRGIYSRKYDYRIIGKKILITLELKVECEKGLFQGYKKVVILEKNYKGYYDLNEMKIDVEYKTSANKP